MCDRCITTVSGLNKIVETVKKEYEPRLREQIAQEIEAHLSSIPERDEYYFGFGDGWTDALSKASAIARGKKNDTR